MPSTSFVASTTCVSRRGWTGASCTTRISGFASCNGTSDRSEVPLHDANPEIRVVHEAPVHPRRLTHVVLATNDVDGMSKFYERIGGLQPVYRQANTVALLR